MLDLKEKLKITNEVVNKLPPMYSEETSKMAKILGIGSPLEKGDYFQQGDCLIIQLGDENFIDSPIKIEGELQKSNLILKGEMNSHAVYEGEYEIYKNDKHTFLRVRTFTVLDHVKDEKFRQKAEHHAQWIPAGEYYLGQVNEYDYFEKLSRKIID